MADGLVKPKEIQYRGRTVKLIGDGTLMEFASLGDAVAFAVEGDIPSHGQECRPLRGKRSSFGTFRLRVF